MVVRGALRHGSAPGSLVPPERLPDRMPSRPRYLVVDDEPQIRRAVRQLLEAVSAGDDGPPAVSEAATGRDALTLAAAEQPLLVVLDLGLPDMDGMEVCRELRRWSEAPILVLTARHDDQSTIRALDAGADDFVSKPFSPPALQARVRALLRRSQRGADSPAARSVIVVGALQIDLGARTVHRHGERVHLTPTEFDLLATLATNAGRVMTHAQLFATVWKGRVHGDAQAHLRVHVGHLRRKLEDDPVRPHHLQTELGVGYRFVID